MRDHTRDVVKKLIDLGCDYVHLDAPNYSQWHIDPRMREAFASWGRDLDQELIEDAEIDNSVFDGLSGITRAIHLCRGNAPGGRWLADGGYGRIAAELFPRLSNYDTLLLEYDTPRAGDFSPLAHVRKDTTVVLGLVTTKDGKLEDPALVEARVREAARLCAAGAAGAQPAVRLRLGRVRHHHDARRAGGEAAAGGERGEEGVAHRVTRSCKVGVPGRTQELAAKDCYSPEPDECRPEDVCH